MKYIILWYVNSQMPNGGKIIIRNFEFPPDLDNLFVYLYT